MNVTLLDNSVGMKTQIILSFGNDLLQISRLTRSTRILLDLFVITMRDSDNNFYLGEGCLDDYLKYCRETLKIDYSEKTLRESISELLKNGIIYRHYAVNNYIVNPALYCKFEGFNRRAKIFEMIMDVEKLRKAAKKGGYVEVSTKISATGNRDFEEGL